MPEPARNVDTARVPGRRTLHFETLDDVLAEAERLCRGEVVTLGNWSLAQILVHLARGMDTASDGFPGPRPPWYIRAAARLFKRRILSGRMNPGVKQTEQMARESAAVELPVEEALEQFRTALARFEAAEQRQPHAFFGRITHGEWTQLTLRHCELHLSFVLPLGAGHHS